MGDKVPRLVFGVDIRQFKLDPVDGFVMTRIDGKRGAAQLARETGVPDFSIARTLEKLERLGIVELVDPNAPPAATPLPPPPKPQAKSALGDFDAGLLAPKYDPSELEASVDLTLEQKKRILDLYYRLDDLDHYTLLGTTRDADKKSVKRAYFELAAWFHPDRYFKKDLGSFKPKVEALFSRITEAHDTLVDKVKRAEYDSYLAEVATTRGMEAMFERALAESPRLGVPEASPPSSDVTSPDSSAAPTGAASLPPPRSPSPDEIQRRKEALARRLTGGARGAAASAGPRQQPPRASEAPSPLRYDNPADAVDALRRRYMDRVENAAHTQLHHYLQTADKAQATGDLVAASTALGLAAKLDPGDATLAARAAETLAAAERALCESYLEQATYEEEQSHWPEAARSWTKIARIRRDAHAHGKAANALLRCPEGDLHLAAEHAKQAIARSPEIIENHILLAEVYLKAGLTVSARRAAEAASAIDPKHASLQALQKRLGKA